nr:PAS domain S-box protein [Methylobacterium radiodurans]
MPNCEQMLQRQKVLADFGEFALESQDLDAILTEACRLVADVLGTGRAKILEIQHDGTVFLVRAGVGWAADVVGHVRLPVSEHSLESYSIAIGRPVVTQDIRAETRFTGSAFMRAAGVIALANAPIFLPGRKAYGLLQVDATEPRDFTPEDTEFLRTYTIILGPLIDRLHKLHALDASEVRQAFLLRLSDELQPLAEPRAIMEIAVGALAGQLDVSQVGYASVQPDGRTIRAQVRYADRESPQPRSRDMELLGSELLARQRAGHTIALADVGHLAAANPELWQTLDARAFVSVPLVRGGRLVTVLYAAHRVPRTWTPDEISLIEQVAARTWDAVERAEAERALRASEERFRSLAEQAEAGIVLVDADDRVTFANDRYCEILGRARTELVGRSMRELTHPEDWPANARLLRRTLAEGIPFTIEKRYLRPDATPVWVRNAVSALREAGGQIVGGCIIAIDITERREAEERLGASEARLRLALDASRLGVWSFEVESDRFVFDARTAEISGLAPVGQLDANTIWAAVHPEDRALLQARLAEVLDPGGSGWSQAEGRFIHPDGAVRWIQARAQIVHADGQRQPGARVLGTLLDISEQRAAELALRASKARLRTLVEGVPHLVWRATAWGDRTWSSPQWCAYTGLSELASRGLGWLEAVHPQDRGGVMAAWRATEQLEALMVEHRLHDVQAACYRWFSTRAVPVRDVISGEITEWFGTSTDIDALRQLQERQSVMVAELQHRTRNLIGVVRSVAQQTLKNARSLDVFRVQFNDRLSALSRVQSLLSRSEQAPITLRTLIQSELDALGAAAMQDRINLVGPTVALRKATVQTFALALHELATNARKYGALTNERGRLEITWCTYQDEQGGSRLLLEWFEAGIVRLSESREPVRRGYGRELIEKALPYALKARTCYALNESELRCSIDIPLTDGLFMKN